MNQQRQVIYNRRRDILERDTARDQVLDIIAETVSGLAAAHAQPNEHSSEWTWEDLAADFSSRFYTPFPVEVAERDGVEAADLKARLLETARDAYEHRRQVVDERTFNEVEKAILLHTIDTCWQEHLYEMDELKEGVGFAGVGGKDPLLVYQKEAFEMFESLIGRIDIESLSNLFQLRFDAGPVPERGPRVGRGQLSDIHREATNLGFRGSAGPVEASGQGEPVADGLPLGRPAGGPRDQGLATAGSEGGGPAKKTPVRAGPKVGRNQSCPCGSGKKYKHCHGRT
jgi:preprotein translocase subunit SecA